MERENTGWRRLAPAVVAHATTIDEVTQKELFECVRMAAIVLGLKAAPCRVLETLASFYRGEPILGRLLVWPSNELLVERTRLSERAIRYTLAQLIHLEILGSRDSPHGKRFARRSESGQILDAYGLDLTPLIHRREELEQRLKEIRREDALRRAGFDEITVCRRAAREALVTIEEWFPEIDTRAQQTRFEALEALTPRRSSRANPEAALAAWQALREEVESIYLTAYAGKNCRQKETTNEAPDQSCAKGQGENGAAGRASLSLIDLVAACPDALAYAEPIDNEADLVREARELRGRLLQAHKSAWTEAVDNLGPVLAAAAVIVVLQIYTEQSTKIRSPGGFFRSYARRMAAGEIDLGDVIRTMRRKRSH